MDKLNCNFISWNVRGLNLKAKRDVVRETISSSLASVACLQETKLNVIDSAIAKEILGPSFDGYVYLPASHTRGVCFWGGTLSLLPAPSLPFENSRLQ